MKFDFKPQEKENLAGVYVHFPYCIQKCDYCDFYSVSTKNVAMEQEKLFECYEQELNQRIQQNHNLENLKFNTIFIGGGTPSRAKVNLLERLIQILQKRLNFQENTEICLESNPEDLTEENINSWKQIGFNRINLGVQTFQETLLNQLNRFFDKQKYENIIQVLQKSTIKRYGADLMYGIPFQKKEGFFEDLQKLLQSNVNHISLYSLTLENNTAYYQKVKKNQKKKPNEDLQAELLIQIPDYLKKHGFYQYEVSNFAKKNNESQHNLKYWTMEYYLALGPSAHGFLPNGRYANTRSIFHYLNETFQTKYEPIDYYTEMCLCLFRLFKPINLNSFLEKLSISKQKKVYSYLNQLSDKDLCYLKNTIFQWKPKAILNLDFYIFELCNL